MRDDTDDWIDVACRALSRPKVLSAPRVQRMVRRGGRLSTTQAAAHREMSVGAFRALYGREPSLLAVGVPVDAEGAELPPDRAKEAVEYWWDVRLLDLWFREERGERCALCESGYALQ